LIGRHRYRHRSKRLAPEVFGNFDTQEPEVIQLEFSIAVLAASGMKKEA
jgi:hypothetical protein